MFLVGNIMSRHSVVKMKQNSAALSIQAIQCLHSTLSKLFICMWHHKYYYYLVGMHNFGAVTVSSHHHYLSCVWPFSGLRTHSTFIFTRWKASWEL